MLIEPVDGNPEVEDWLAEYGLDSGDRRGRPPTVAEVRAMITKGDDDAPATDLSVRGGDFDVVMQLARRLAAATGPLVAMSASEGEPVVID